MTFLEAAYIVLREHGCPMDVDKIIMEVHDRRLWRSRAQPKWVHNSLYGTLIKACQAGDPRFDRIGNGPMFRGR